VHLGGAFVADQQLLELVEVREGALDDRADSAESETVPGLAAGDHRRDPALTKDGSRADRGLGPHSELPRVSQSNRYTGQNRTAKGSLGD
jgi:hypothetical protein